MRYLTLKNFGLFVGVLTILFVAITIRSERRGPESSNFGRIVEREFPVPRQQPLEIVTESGPAPYVREQSSADPMLVRSAEKEKWLVDQTAPAPVAEPPVSEWADMETRLKVTSSEPGGLVVVGGPDGVEVVRRSERRPVLSGGFGN